MLKKILLSFLGLFLFIAPALAQENPAPLTLDPTKSQLFFFWGDGCPHCAAAQPFLQDLAKKYPNLQIISFEIYNVEANQTIVQDFAQMAGFNFEGVPVFIIGNEHSVGFGTVDNSGKSLEDVIKKCLDSKCQTSDKILQYIKDHQITTWGTIDANGMRSSTGETQNENQNNSGSNRTKYYYIIPAAVIALFVIIYFVRKTPKK